VSTEIIDYSWVLNIEDTMHRAKTVANLCAQEYLDPEERDGEQEFDERQEAAVAMGVSTPRVSQLLSPLKDGGPRHHAIKQLNGHSLSPEKVDQEISDNGMASHDPSPPEPDRVYEPVGTSVKILRELQEESAILLEEFRQQFGRYEAQRECKKLAEKSWVLLLEDYVVINPRAQEVVGDWLSPSWNERGGYHPTGKMAEVYDEFETDNWKTTSEVDVPFNGVPGKVSDLYKRGALRRRPNDEGAGFQYVQNVQSGKYQTDDLTHSDLKNCGSQEFEQIVAEIWSHLGWDTEVTPQSGDGGKDVICDRGDERTLIECKRTNSPVSVSAAHQLEGARALEDDDVNALIVTTAESFTSNTVNHAEETHDMELIRRSGLMEIIEENDLESVVLDYLGS
jgi:hypothetical protein